MAKKQSKKKEVVKKVDDNALLIVAERDAKYVELDVEFGNTMYKHLLSHGKSNILNDEEAVINWAFIDLLTKGMEYCESKDK